jgi:hypothetical protein
LAWVTGTKCVPTLSKNDAAKIAFVMLLGGWPVDRIAHALRRVQEGTALSQEGGDKAPLYIVRAILDEKQKGKTIQAVKQIGLFLSAAFKSETGMVASARVLRAEVDKELPSPVFVPVAQAA